MSNLNSGVPAELYIDLEDAKKATVKAQKHETTCFNRVKKWKQEQCDKEQLKLFKN